MSLTRGAPGTATTSAPAAPPQGEAGAGAMNCLVDGQTAPQPAWINHTYEGTVCLFCSERCRALFEADPERFLGRPTQGLVRPPGYT